MIKRIIQRAWQLTCFVGFYLPQFHLCLLLLVTESQFSFKEPAIPIAGAQPRPDLKTAARIIEKEEVLKLVRSQFSVVTVKACLRVKQYRDSKWEKSPKHIIQTSDPGIPDFEFRVM